MDKLQVLFLATWYPNQFDSLGGIYIKEHAKALAGKADLNVFHVCASPRFRDLLRFEIVEDAEFKTFYIYYYKVKGKFWSPINVTLYMISGLVGLFKVLNKIPKPDLLHVHVLTRMGVFALLTHVFHRIPYVISEHWSRYLPERNSYRGFLRKSLTQSIVRYSSGISAVSSNLLSAMNTFELKHPHQQLISNTLDVELFMPIGRKKMNAKFKFLHISGFTAQIKNAKGILDAIALLSKKRTDFFFDVIGDDGENERWQAYVEKLQIGHLVKIHGELPHQTLPFFYQQADAFVLFSNFENQPCVLLEAFACGLPVIATKVGGIPELVNDRNGMLVDAGDEKQLAEMLNSMMTKAKYFDHHEIREKAVNQFSYATVADKLLSFYREALAH